jgi:OOP family OmpA-OmpF porin
MKHINILVLILLLNNPIFAQNETFRWGIGAHVSRIDYIGPLTNNLTAFNLMSTNPTFTLGRYINNSWDIGLDMATGKIAFPILENNNSFRIKTGKINDFNISLIYKLANGYIFDKKSKLYPILTIGTGINQLSIKDINLKTTNLAITPGLGFRYHVTNRFSLQYKSSYHIISNQSDFLSHSIGLIYNFNLIAPVKKSKEVPSNLIENSKKDIAKIDLLNTNDSDNDGVANANDKCPNITGLAKYSGCPDTDKDGFPDYQDKCPNEFGTVFNMGCPEGVNPNSTNIANANSKNNSIENQTSNNSTNTNNGTNTETKINNTSNSISSKSADPDVNNNSLKSNSSASNNSENATPAYTMAFFDFNEYVIKPQFYDSLNLLSQILIQDPSTFIRINGHADNVGEAEYNVLLSLNRSSAVRNYLVSQGVNLHQISCWGYGYYKPLSNNDSEQGRSRNRRAEIHFTKAK